MPNEINEYNLLIETEYVNRLLSIISDLEEQNRNLRKSNLDIFDRFIEINRDYTKLFEKYETLKLMLESNWFYTIFIKVIEKCQTK